MWICTGNKLAKFQGNILSLSENIAKSFRGGYFFLTHTVDDPVSGAKLILYVSSRKFVDILLIGNLLVG